MLLGRALKLPLRLKTIKELNRHEQVFSIRSFKTLSVKSNEVLQTTSAGTFSSKRRFYFQDQGSSKIISRATQKADNFNSGLLGDTNTSNKNGNSFSHKTKLLGSVFAGSLGVFLSLKYKSKILDFLSNESFILHAKEPVGCLETSELDENLGAIVEDLPSYTLEDVAKHTTWDERIWMIYRYGVYDMTDFIADHPGGSDILMAAGKRLDDFMKIYSFHCHNNVLDMLEKYRIGNCPDPNPRPKKASACDPYQNDPERLDVFVVNCCKPFNGETPSQLLGERFITPPDAYFICNHLPVPCINPDCYCLEVQRGNNCGKLNLSELKCCLAKSSVIATGECPGNRKAELHKIRPVKDVIHNIGAIGNAKWSGTTLNNLLNHFGIDIDTVKEKHIIFEGTDVFSKNCQPFSASIPVEIARKLKNDIIVAYEMNGSPIPRDHGYPVRIILPGISASRHVKWLKKVYFSDQESCCIFQKSYYNKGFSSSACENQSTISKAEPIIEMPVNSAICSPIDGEFVERDACRVKLEGYAYSGGGRGIVRVDVSIDGGETWQQATLFPNNQSKFKSWSWTLWEAQLLLPDNDGPFELICKAADVAHNVQPDTAKSVWNFAGNLNNSWHRIKIQRKPKPEEDTPPN